MKRLSRIDKFQELQQTIEILANYEKLRIQICSNCPFAFLLLGGLSLHLKHHMRQITIGHLGHFLWDFLAQIWTQRTLRHILGPILVIFEICQFFLWFQGRLSTSQKMSGLRKSKFSWWRSDCYPLIGLVLGGEVPRLNHGPICFPIQNT